MNSRYVLRCFIISTVVLTSVPGCKKKEDSSSPEGKAVPESNIQVPIAEVSDQSVSELMEQFLGKVVKTKKASTGYEISEFFSFWQELLHNPRISMEIYFDLDVDEEFKRDHIWENKSNREILDDLCKEYNLTWTITNSDTIKIAKQQEPLTRTCLN